MTVKRYRKKPLVIEALEYHSALTSQELKDFCPTAKFRGKYEFQSSREIVSVIEIDTLEGTMVAAKGDWIIKGVAGEFYPCKPHIFRATYDEAEDGQ